MNQTKEKYKNTLFFKLIIYGNITARFVRVSYKSFASEAYTNNNKYFAYQGRIKGWFYY